MELESINLRYDPMRFVFNYADDVTGLHLLEFLDLLETKKGQSLILCLLKSQMSSGGFPSKFDQETEGIRETCRNSLLLLECGIPREGLNIQSAINFLLGHQRENGGWSENPELSLPEKVIELSNTQAVTWLTADIIELLRQVGLTKSEPCIKALNWLRKTQKPDGGWSMFQGDRFRRSDPDSTAQILFMMREIYGEDDRIWLKGIKLFEESLDELARNVKRGYYMAPNGEKRENDIYHLTHLLLSSLVDSRRRIEAGYDLSDSRVKQIIQAIVDSQREDGGWSPFWTQKSSSTYTVLTLKLLSWLKALDMEKLRKQATTHL